MTPFQEAQRAALTQQAEYAREVIRQGYNERQAKRISALVYPTPAQARMKRAREAIASHASIA